MPSDAEFGEAVHALLKELGWTHGELTPSLVHQALAQVRHLRKLADTDLVDARAKLRREQDARAELRVELDGVKAQLEPAKDVIAYALRRFQVDPEFAYHMWHTETLARLIRAYAVINGLDPGDVRKQVEANAKELPESRCATDRGFIDGGCSV